LIKVPEERVNVPWSRPEATDVFVSVGYPISTEVSDSDWLLTEAGVILNSEG
jgi:hypothetical protein